MNKNIVKNSVITITVASFILSPFLIEGLGYWGFAILLLGVLYVGFFSIFYKIYHYLFFLFLNPMIIIPLYFSLNAYGNYIVGTPKLIHCTFYERDEAVYDEEKRIFLTYHDDDCDWPFLDMISSDLSNQITLYLIEKCGHPEGTYLGTIPKVEDFCDPIFWENNAYKIDKKTLNVIIRDFEYHFWAPRELDDIEINWKLHEFRGLKLNDELIVIAGMEGKKVYAVSLYLLKAKRSIKFCDCNSKN